MSDGGRRLTIVCEGDTDRALLEKLVKAKHLPDTCEPVKRPAGGPDGVEGVAQALAERADAGQRVVALRDLDEARSAEAARDVLLESMRAHRPRLACGAFTSEREGRVHRVRITGINGAVEAIIVLVGLGGDAELAKLGIVTQTLDDYLLRGVLRQPVYACFASSERYVEQDHARVVGKIDELRDLFVRNGMTLRSS